MLKAARVRQVESLETDIENMTPSTPALSATIATPTVPVMTGTHFHSLDEKGRVIIPAKLRPALTEQFWLMLDESDNVAIYNYQTGLDVLEYLEQMMREHPGDEDIAAAVERSTGAADLVTVEGNWRVPVSELLRFHAQLDKEIVTVGVLNHAVMWNREHWEAAQARRLQSPEVRRVQAEMLRAAASGIKKKSQMHEQAKTEEIIVTPQAAPAIETARVLGARPGDVDASGRPVKSVAPAGDGKRSPRVFTLSQLGR